MASLANNNADTQLPQEMVDFLNKAWTCFHAIEVCKNWLNKAGYTEIKERSIFKGQLKQGGKYYFTRNDSSIVAFAIGSKYESGNGFIAIGAHSDSPCLKLKPNSKITSAGYQQIGLQTYGGGLWNTWFDRDLGVAGRVIIRNPDTNHVQIRNVKIDDAICRIPTLAIHLARGTGTKLEINTETHLPAVIASVVKAELGGKSESKNGQHHSVLIDLLATELNCDPNHIDDFELQLCEVQPSTIGGAKKEFIYSGRLDNLCSVYCGLRALIDTTADDSNLAEEESIRLLAVFDHEEIGSTSTSGARGTLMTDSINRITNAFAASPNIDEVVERTTQKSYLISSDMAHGIHPNYPSKHEKNHGPKFHDGVVIKTNVNQRYATVSIAHNII